MAHPDDVDLIHQAAAFRPARDVNLTVRRCQYNCCGHGWLLRSGYEQHYTGYVDNVTASGFTLVSRGIGTVSYSLLVNFADVEIVEWA